MERRCSAGEVRLETRGDGQTPVITGYAARFYDPNEPGTEYVIDMGKWGKVRERIMPGAFTRAAAEDDVRALFNHSPSLILGRKSAGTLRLSVDGLGLRYEVDPPDTQTARDLMESLRRGDVSGSSFAFSIRTGGQTWKEFDNAGTVEDIRELTDLQVWDVGPVTFPAYPAASSGLRSEDTDAIRKELEIVKRQKTAEADELQRRIASYQRRVRVVEIGS